MVKITNELGKVQIQKQLKMEVELITSYKQIKSNDLVIFPGGVDINPKIYGEENICSFFSTERDYFELKVLEFCIKSDIKILGICRGHQLLNAFLGGKLIQDLSLINVKHELYHPLEEINSNIINFDNVLSMHHQGVIIPGENLKITSWYKGVIESTENNNIITVQFHPEFMDCPEFWMKIKNWIKNGGEK